MPLAVSASITTTLPDVPEAALRLERLGYDAATCGETRHNPFLPLTLVAEHTERLRLGTSVAIAFPRVPYVTAMVAWDLARYSGGRFYLGLGTQVKAHNERRFSVPWEPPGPRLRDYVATLRAIWDSWQHGTRPDFESAHYQYRLSGGADFNPGPIEHPDIPVVLSAMSPFNASLAGEIADGIAVHDFTSFHYLRTELIPALHEGARRAGRDPRTLQVHGGGFVVTGRTEAEVEAAREDARRRLAAYASTRAYADVMRAHGWTEEAEALRRAAAEGGPEAASALVTDAMLDECCVIGTWEALPALIRERYAGLTSMVHVAFEARSKDDEMRIADVIRAIHAVPSIDEAV